MSFAEGSSRPNRAAALAGEARHLVGGWGSGAFRVGRQNVDISVAGPGRVEVRTIDIKAPRPDHSYQARTARIAIDSATKRPTVTEVTTVVRPDKEGRLQLAEGEPTSIQQLPDVGSRYFDPVAFLATLKDVGTSVGEAKKALSHLKLDKYGRTREEAGREKENAKVYEDRTNSLISLAVKEQSATRVGDIVYANQGGSSSVPLYQVHFYPALGGDIDALSGIDNVIITQYEKPAGLFRGREIGGKVTVNYTDREHPQVVYISDKGRIIESTYIGKERFGITPLQVEEGEIFLTILGSLNESHLHI